MASQALLGVDVGFSETRKTTGLAWISDTGVHATVTGSSWSERKRDLPADITFRLAALDAPIVPTGDADHRRGCEYVFYGGAFAKRCRPGLSHHGRGIRLRHAGTQAANEFAKMLLANPLAYVRFLSWSKSLGLPKSDWLYEQLMELGIMRMLLSRLTLNETSISDVFEKATNHDERAALVCLLTAMLAAKGDAVIVGDDHGGWFWLPPMELWAGWAQDSLKLALSKHQRGGFRNTARWAAAIPEIS